MTLNKKLKLGLVGIVALLVIAAALTLLKNGIGFTSELIGSNPLSNTAFCCALAALLIGIYMAIRFNIACGVAALGAMLYDSALILCLMTILGFVLPAGASFGAAILSVCVFSAAQSVALLTRLNESESAPAFANSTHDEIAAGLVRSELKNALRPAACMALALAIVIALCPAGVRAFALSVLLGLCLTFVTRALFTGYVWAALRALRKPRKK